MGNFCNILRLLQFNAAYERCIAFIPIKKEEKLKEKTDKQIYFQKS